MGNFNNTSPVAGTCSDVSSVLHGRISRGLNIDYGHFSCTNPGQDLSGSLQGAGGIGGLLSWQTGTNCYFYVADANGNISELVNSRNPTNVLARYSYDPYGNILSSSGTLATSNTWRYSSKYWDVETGLGNWGYRYYDSVRGRWVGRDRIGERGGKNLYAYCGNNSIGRWDLLGNAQIAVAYKKDASDSEMRGEENGVSYAGKTEFSKEIATELPEYETEPCEQHGNGCVRIKGVREAKGKLNVLFLKGENLDAVKPFARRSLIAHEKAHVNIHIKSVVAVENTMKQYYVGKCVSVSCKDKMVSFASSALFAMIGYIRLESARLDAEDYPVELKKEENKKVEEARVFFKDVVDKYQEAKKDMVTTCGKQ